MSRVSRIGTAGLIFIDQDRKRLPKVGFDQYAMVPRWVAGNGPAVLVEPNLREIHNLALEGGLGADVPIALRCFCEALPNPQYHQFGFIPESIGIPAWRKVLRDATEYCLHWPDRQFLIEWTAGDRQYLRPLNPPEGWRGGNAHPVKVQEILNESRAALVDLPHWFEEMNERWNNGNCFDLRAPKFEAGGSVNCPSVIASGYYADSKANWPLAYVRDYLTFHSERAVDFSRWPKLVYDIPASISYCHSYYNIAVDLNEPYRFDENSDPAWAEAIGTFIALCAGVCYHSNQGRDGNGFQNTPRQREGAVRYFRGIAAGLKASAL